MAFPSNCNPRIIDIEASNDGSLTRASIVGATPQWFENQGFEEVGMDRVIAQAQEARAAGYRENTLEMLLMGRVASVKSSVGKQNIGGNQSAILPYIYRRQKHVINANYWIIETGAANPQAGVGGVHPGAWDLTIINSSSTYASPMTAIQRYFVPGKFLHVENVDGSGNAQSLNFKIVATVNANAGGTEKAKVTVEPPYGSSGWGALTAAEQTAYNPTDGVAIVMGNSVSDYESWGENEPANNPNKLLTFWLQNFREAHEFDEEYLKALEHALTSNYFKDFRQLPMAEQRRQQHLEFVKSWMNSIWYGSPEDEDNQTVENYANLPSVVDPARPTAVLEYKSNLLGFDRILRDCSRVLDHQGNPLNLDTLASTGYNMKRAREADGGTVNRIDWMTDRWTAGAIQQIMTTFYKAKYGVGLERYYQPNQALTFQNQVMLNFDVYQLPPDLGGYEFAVAYHPFFEDRIVASPTTNLKNRHRVMWGIDWSDVTIGVAETNSVMRETNEADELYKYTMKINKSKVQLNSMNCTSILEDPNRHYVVENFSDGNPVLTVPGYSV